MTDVGVLKELASCNFRFRGFKDKNTLRRMYLKVENTKLATKEMDRGQKARSQLRLARFQLKMQQTMYPWSLHSLNKSTEASLIYLKVFKHGKWRGWFFGKLTEKEKEGTTDVSLG